MASASVSRPTAAVPLSTKIVAGVAGGLVGGVMFGLLMQMMGMITMVAMLVGSDSAAIGWLVHLAISAFAGAVFAVVFGGLSDRLPMALGLGAAYGAIWWVFGALLLMPARLGMPVFTFNAAAMQSLMGHLIFGLFLGGVFALALLRLRR